MSQETIDILRSQLPLFEKMRRSAMLTYAMRGTVTKKKLLDYVMTVQEMAWQIIQINEHTINVMEKELGDQNDADTATSEGRSTEVGAGQTPVGTGSREEQLAEITKALGEHAAGEGTQLTGGGSVEIDPAASRTAG